MLFRYVDSSNSNRGEVLFNTDQTMTVREVNRLAGVETVAFTAVASGLTHVANTFYRLRVQYIRGGSSGSNQVRIKAWLDGTTEPLTWMVQGTISAPATTGLWGFTSNRETSNTNANATVDFDDYTATDGWYRRHTGFVDEWPTRWNDAGLRQMLAPITASGLTRRLQQGGAVGSAIKRAVLTAVVTPKAYWPCEDGSASTQIASGLPGGPPMRITQPMSLGTGRAAGSDPLIVVSNLGRIQGTVQPYSGTDWTVMALINIPAAVAGQQAILQWTTSGSYPVWQLVLWPQAGPDLVTLQAYDNTFTERIADTGVNFVGEPYGQQLWIEVAAQQVGPDISWLYVIWSGTSGSSGTGKIGTKTGAIAGTVTGMSFGNGSGANLLTGTTLGHLSAWDNATISFPMANSGWSGEVSGDRLVRLGGQERTPLAVTSTQVSDFATMGAPTSGTLLSQVREIETAEQGIVYDDVDGKVVLLTREDRVNQAVGLTLDISQHQVGWPLEPADDDQQLRNDVTSTGTTGSSYRYLDTTGPNAVGEVGYYSATRSVNLANDQDLRQDAEFAVALGTVDEIRYPQVPLNLTRSPELIPAWLAMNVGNRLQVTHPPSVLTPDLIDLILEGYTEKFDTETWTVAANTSSARPWNAWIVENGVGNQSRLDSGASTLAGPVTSGATTLPVSTTSGYPLWVTGSVAFDIGVGGEQITVSNIAALLSDTFTRTTSSGWGTADTGQTWTTFGGSASDYSTNGSQGVHNLSTTVTQRLSSLAVGLGPVDVYADWIHVPAAPTGSGAVTLSLMACKPDASNYVELQLFATVGGTMTVAVAQIAGGSVVAQDASFPSVGPLTSIYSARLHITNTVVQGRVWVRGTTEPTTWTTSIATASTPQVGDVAWRTERSSGTTNVAPFFIELDGLSLPTGQAFTATRSVNVVTKAQLVGTKVSLWRPSVLAL